MVSNSDTYHMLYTKAAVGCKLYNQIQQCQILSNLCVLNMYTGDSNVCRLVKDIISTKQTDTNTFYSDDGYKQGMPWIYYMQGTTTKNAVNVLHDSGRVKFRASFSYVNKEFGIVKSLKFKIAKYDLVGNFRGFEDFNHQLFICKTSNEMIEKLMSIGTTMINTCSFDLSKVLSATEAPQNMNMFYEVYLEDYNGDLIDVPVKIKNLVNEFNDEPNMLPDMTEWELVRRFFVIDTKSGIGNPGGFKLGSTPEIVRYAKELSIKVELDPNAEYNEMIFPPYIEVMYEEKRSSDILGSTATGKLADISFKSEYFMETTGFWDLARTLFIILISFFVVIILVKIVIDSR